MDENGHCLKCGSDDVDVVDCWNCGGKGYFDDLHFVDPLWYDEDDTEPCDICDGDGHFVICRTCTKRAEEAVRVAS